MNLVSQKMGMQRVELPQRLQPVERQKMQHVDLTRRFEQLNIEVELGFTAEQTAREVQRCLNCDVETVFTAQAVHRVRRLHRHLPGAVPHHHAQRRRRRSCASASRRPRTNLTQELYVSAPLPQTGRVMVKDEDLCVHCGLCAERCPTAAWDMQKFELLIPYAGTRLRAAMRSNPRRLNDQAQPMPQPRSRVNDFALKLANVNGTGSASANSLLMQAIFRMGIPVIGQELFPVQHPGPADLVRDPRQQGRLHGARSGLTTSWWR